MNRTAHSQKWRLLLKSVLVQTLGGDLQDRFLALFSENVEKATTVMYQPMCSCQFWIRCCQKP